MNPDIAYANADFIDGAEDYPPLWATLADAFRTELQVSGRAQLDVRYGPGERHVFDLFLPPETPRGLVIFVHGGYWVAFDKSSWSHLSAGALAHGWAVAIPSYTLAPEAKIADITQEVKRVVEAAAARIEGPISLTGHSAGGHLVARMNCADVGLSGDVAARIKRIVPISPVADLRPLVETQMNDDFRLDIPQAKAESPMLHTARHGIKTHVWVGENERPVFLGQARWLAESWEEADLNIAANTHHFNVIDALADPKSALLKTLLI